MIENFWSLVIFVFISAITPGPNNIMLLTSGLNFGWRRSLPHWWGIVIGMPILVVTIGLGFGVVFEQLTWLHTLIKTLGIIYLCFLSWKIANSSAQEQNRLGSPLTFVQSLLFQWINPKAWVMGSSAIVAFSSQTNIFWDTLLIAFVFFIFTFPSISIWLLGGQTLQALMKKPGLIRWFNISMGLLLLFSILPIAIELLAELSGLYYQPF